ncbi:MAG: 2,3-bisphosphoglycerate-independent phosphoglycerate mutase [Planctomycetota bacterium]|nr:2,3-bisphosphoglycerate-independent phosphoglycerate mutase [Planctomycetota bacterium]
MNPTRTRRSSPVVLIIRDGWGRNPHPEHDGFNAVKLAATPNADRLERDWPTTLIRTSGEDVGLPIGDDGPVMGNSEVGHQNIGAGRIVDQELMRITNAIRSGAFAHNAVLREAIDRARKGPARLHIMGLVSDGQVHSDLSHLDAILEFARVHGVPSERIFVHAFLDGRDTSPFSGARYLAHVEQTLSTTGGRIATICGRFWSMDRDHRWDRVARAWSLLTTPTADSRAEVQSSQEVIVRAYAHPLDPSRKGDEFVEPIRLLPCEGVIEDGDSVVFSNFRGDRPRELCKAFVLDEPSFRALPGGGFDRGPVPTDLFFATMSNYEEGLPVRVIFQRPPKMESILGAVIADGGLTQFRCAESEKFPHVTFFFNDYREAPFAGEHRELLPSPRDVATYDLKPEMSAAGVRDAVLRRLSAVDCEPLIIVNFANGDMVGHTGSLPATIKACEMVDACVGPILDAVANRHGAAIVTADHGNAEQMFDPATQMPHTAHTNYTVPLSVFGFDRFNATLRGQTVRSDGRLADVAPTLLALMGIAQPAAMTGQSLVVEKETR